MGRIAIYDTGWHDEMLANYLKLYACMKKAQVVTQVISQSVETDPDLEAQYRSANRQIRMAAESMHRLAQKYT